MAIQHGMLRTHCKSWQHVSSHRNTWLGPASLSSWEKANQHKQEAELHPLGFADTTSISSISTTQGPFCAACWITHCIAVAVKGPEKSAGATCNNGTLYNRQNAAIQYTPHTQHFDGDLEHPHKCKCSASQGTKFSGVWTPALALRLTEFERWEKAGADENSSGWRWTPEPSF